MNASRLSAYIQRWLLGFRLRFQRGSQLEAVAPDNPLSGWSHPSIDPQLGPPQIFIIGSVGSIHFTRGNTMQSSQTFDQKYSTITACQFGNENSMTNFRNIVGEKRLHHPESEEVKQKMLELRQVLESERTISAPLKNEAIKKLLEMSDELEKEDASQDKGLLRYYYDSLMVIVKDVAPMVTIVIGIGKLLGYVP